MFNDIADQYEAWYSTDQGRRADALEKALLWKLLRRISNAHTVLEVGCGTGHFTHWLSHQGLWATGVDVSPASNTCPQPGGGK